MQTHAACVAFSYIPIRDFAWADLVTNYKSCESSQELKLNYLQTKVVLMAFKANIIPLQIYTNKTNFMVEYCCF